MDIKNIISLAKHAKGVDGYYESFRLLQSDLDFFKMYLTRERKSNEFWFKVVPVGFGTVKVFDDIKANADDVIAFLATNPIPDPDYLQYFKLDVKLPFLMDRTREQYNRWKAWYPEANAYIVKNPEISFRTKAVEFMASVGFYPLVWLYATIVALCYKLSYRK